MKMMLNLIGAVIAILILAVPLEAQVLKTIPILAEGNHDAHDYSFGPEIVPVNASLVRVVFETRDVLMGDQRITTVLDLSTTGRVPGQTCATCLDLGQEVFDVLHPIAGFTKPLPERGNAARVIAGRITIYGQGKWKGKAYLELQ